MKIEGFVSLFSLVPRSFFSSVRGLKPQVCPCVRVCLCSGESCRTCSGVGEPVLHVLTACGPSLTWTYLRHCAVHEFCDSFIFYFIYLFIDSVVM